MRRIIYCFSFLCCCLLLQFTAAAELNPDGITGNSLNSLSEITDPSLPPSPSCNGADFVWSGGVYLDSDDRIRNSDVPNGRLFCGDAFFIDLPANFNNSGNVDVDISEYVSADGYSGRCNITSQNNERWYLEFYKGSNLVATSNTTQDVPNGCYEWRVGSLGTVNLPNGADRVRVVHNCTNSNTESVVPTSFCLDLTEICPDSDGDGVCNNDDCAPNNPNFPATPGSSCNDGDPNTTNDMVTSDGCSCTGTPVGPTCSVSTNGCDITITGLNSGDYTKVFDANWNIIFDCNPWANGGCNSTEVFTVPSNGTYHVQACGETQTVTISGCTQVGPCDNAGGDSDGDGICNNDDCAPNNPNFPATPGSSCNDGNPNTTNDMVTSDGCGCAGTPVGPTCSVSTNGCDITITGLDGGDYSKVFDASWNIIWDCNPWANGGCNTTETITVPSNGTYHVQACGQTQSVTISGCTQVGPCDNAGGDSDGDGICNNDDCAPNNPNFPATPGSSCNDGNPNTTNDMVTSDGCGCAGTPVGPTCSVSTNGCDITITGLNGGDYSKVFDASWNIIWDCNPWANGGCDSTETITVPSNGTYHVQACGETESVTISGCTQVGPCDNAGGDSDGDGVCNNDDCAPNNPNFPATPGSSCNDGDPNTTNDMVTSDGCGCAGTPVGPTCSVSTNGCDITITGLNGGDYSKVFDASWNIIWDCNPWANGGCDSTETITVPSNGTYHVQACGQTESVTISGCTQVGPCDNAGGDSDGDGVCNNDDCAPNNPNFPATPGSSCNDGDPNTTNDMVTSDGCGCAGTPVGPTCSVSTNGCNITITGLDGGDYSKVFDASWNIIWDCNPWANGGCNTTETITVPSNGTYHVQACGQTQSVTISGCTQAGPCDNAGGDSDGDGVCNNDDCAPNNPNFPATPGSSCNDGNPNTTNDMVTSDGCGCAGTPVAPTCTGDITGFELNFQDGSSLVSLNNGATFCTSDFSGDFRVRALVSGDHESLRFTITGPDNVSNTENQLPYNSRDIEVHAGTYTVNARLYSGADLGGELCDEVTISFTVETCTPAVCNGVTSIRQVNNLETSCDNANPDRVMWIEGRLYQEIGDLYFIEYDNGTAELKGRVRKVGGSTTWNVDVTFTGRTNNSSPYTNGCGPTSQSSDWYYYSDFSGTVGGRSIHERGHNFQVGVGANRFNNNFGASGWFERNGEDSDFNFNLSGPLACTDDNNNGVIDVCEDGSSNLIAQQGDYLYFDAVKDGRTVAMNWVTNTDYKNDYFEIETSTDGINFEILEEVMSISDSREYVNYQGKDEDASEGTNYYRLKQIFADGSFRYSQVKEVSFDLNLKDFAVYPNPALDQINLSLGAYEGLSAEIMISNSLGQPMQSRSIDSLTDEVVRFEMPNYQPGVYTVRIKLDGKRQMTKMFVISRL